VGYPIERMLSCVMSVSRVSRIDGSFSRARLATRKSKSTRLIKRFHGEDARRYRSSCRERSLHRSIESSRGGRLPRVQSRELPYNYKGLAREHVRQEGDTAGV